jgi:excinuclease UvrABC ATPase subunit
VQLFLPRYGQPDADALHNLSTAIIVGQQPLSGNPRSTFGTATDVYTMFRVLFAAGDCRRAPCVTGETALPTQGSAPP